MAIIVEDGTIVPNANSYVSINECNEYFETFLCVVYCWEHADIIEREKALITATRKIDVSYLWNGYTQDENQSLGWPRTQGVDKYDILIAENYIPTLLKNAVCELALDYLKANDEKLNLDDSPEIGMRRVKIGEIDVEFDRSDRIIKLRKLIRDMLQGLGLYGANQTIRINRA
jgi:hypothetical protein